MNGTSYPDSKLARSIVKKCPKCNGEMEQAKNLSGIKLLTKSDYLGDQIVPFFCKHCGYIEFYKEKKG
jgi:predicted nucleic-acid-binding Zn-ribbon protein